MLDSDQAKELLEDPSRRRFLVATGSIASVVGLASGELGSDEDGSISGGTMAIDDYYTIAEGERTSYVGPDALKEEVTPEDGDRWEATDTQVVYNGDGGDWGEPRGIGSESKPVPTVNTEEVNTVRHVSSFSEAQEAIDNAVDGNGNSPIKVVFEKGTPSPTDDELPLQPNGRTVIEGSGIKTTEVDASGLTNNIIEADSAEHVVVRDMSVWGDFETTSDAVRFIDSPRCMVENFRAVNCDNGIALVGGSYQNLIKFVYSRSNNKNGILMAEGESTNVPNGTDVIGGHFNASTNGAKIERGGSITLNTYFEGNDEYGVLAGGTSGLKVFSSFEKSPNCIGLSPSGEGLNAALGTTINAHFNLQTDQTGVLAGGCRGVTITGSRFRSAGDSGTVALEMEQAADGVVIDRSNEFQTHSNIVGDFLSARRLNGGVWRTSLFKNLDEVAALASNIRTTNNSLTVLLDEDSYSSGDGVLLHGIDFPYGTHFKGRGSGKTELSSSSSSDCVTLRFDNQKLSHVTITGAGRHGVHVAGQKARIENVDIESATNAGVNVNGNNVFIKDVTCHSSNISNDDIDLNSTDGVRVIGCDANVAAGSATNVGQAGNVDTL